MIINEFVLKSKNNYNYKITRSDFFKMKNFNYTINRLAYEIFFKRILANFVQIFFN